MDRGYDLCSPEGRVRLPGGDSGRLLPQGGGVVRRPNLAIQASAQCVTKGDCESTTAAWAHSPFRPGCAVRLRSLHPGASRSPDDAEHKSARESVRQRQLRKLYEDTQTGGDICQRLPRSETPSRERREIHRALLQSMPFTFSSRLPPTRRVRRRIKTATLE